MTIIETHVYHINKMRNMSHMLLVSIYNNVINNILKFEGVQTMEPTRNNTYYLDHRIGYL